MFPAANKLAASLGAARYSKTQAATSTVRTHLQRHSFQTKQHALKLGEEYNVVIGSEFKVDSNEDSARQPWGTPRILEGDATRIALKDNIATAGVNTTCASGVLKDYKSPYNATVVDIFARMKAESWHKTNMDEFGMGSHSTFSHFGPVVQGQKSAGGSSGGSAVAVAIDLSNLGIGTDTGGSVRLPAAYNGIVGFKPSYGVIPRYGVVPYANSLDTVGFMTKGIDSMSNLHWENLMEHYDDRDPTSPTTKSRRRFAQRLRSHIKDQDESQLHNSDPRLKRLKVGVPLEYNIEELGEETRTAWATALQRLRDQGHDLVPISLPMTKYALSAYYVLAAAEAASNLSKYDGVRYGTRSEGTDNEDGGLYCGTRAAGFGEEVKRRILLGSFVLSSEAIDNHFIQAQKVRRLVQKDFDRIFALGNPLRDIEQFDLSDMPEEMVLQNKLGIAQVDVIVCPTTTTAAPMIDELKELGSTAAYTNDVFTVPASLAGLPAISVPITTLLPDQPSKISIGIQVIGQYWDDCLVVDVGRLVMLGN